MSIHDSFRLVSDALLVLRRGVLVDRCRAVMGPRHAVSLARALGSKIPPRSPQQRATLGRLIRMADRFWMGGPNCYRRVLLEIATDREAARHSVTMGFMKEGGARSGHAWLGPGAPPDQPGRRYDAIISI